MNQRKTITEPVPAPADDPEPTTPIEALAEVLASLRDSGGPLLRPGVYTAREVADRVLSDLLNFGFVLVDDEK